MTPLKLTKGIPAIAAASVLFTAPALDGSRCDVPQHQGAGASRDEAPGSRLYLADLARAIGENRAVPRRVVK